MNVSGKECNITMNPDQLVELISKEICNHPDFLKYLRIPVTQDEIDYKLMSFKKSSSRGAADMYIPAISSALDLHIRTIQNISAYYGAVNTYPISGFTNKKTVILVLIDGVYHPVVSNSLDEELPPVPPSAAPVQDMYQPPATVPVIIISSDSEPDCAPESSTTAFQGPYVGVIPETETDSQDTNQTR